MAAEPLALATDSTPDSPHRFVADGQSAPLMWADADLDDLAAAFEGQANPLVQLVDMYGFGQRLDLLDADIQASLALRQHFTMEYHGMSAELVLEDGTRLPFDIDTGIVLQNALSHDADGDGQLALGLSLTPQVTFTNSTEIGHDFTWAFDLLKGITELDPFMTPIPGDGGNEGETWEALFNASFVLPFQSQELWFVA